MPGKRAETEGKYVEEVDEANAPRYAAQRTPLRRQ